MEWLNHLPASGPTNNCPLTHPDSSQSASDFNTHTPHSSPICNTSGALHLLLNKNSRISAQLTYVLVFICLPFPMTDCFSFPLKTPTIHHLLYHLVFFFPFSKTWLHCPRNPWSHLYRHSFSLPLPKLKMPVYLGLVLDSLLYPHTLRDHTQHACLFSLLSSSIHPFLGQVFRVRVCLSL